LRHSVEAATGNQREPKHICIPTHLARTNHFAVCKYDTASYCTGFPLYYRRLAFMGNRVTTEMIDTHACRRCCGLLRTARWCSTLPCKSSDIL